MLAFYEEEAVMLFEPGRAICGRVALRAALQPLMTAKLIAKHEAKYVIEAGDIALWISAWSVIGTAADGVPISRNGRNAVVFEGVPMAAGASPWRIHGCRRAR
jgi:ketosteroid isomerase-like protein